MTNTFPKFLFLATLTGNVIGCGSSDSGGGFGTLGSGGSSGSTGTGGVTLGGAGGVIVGATGGTSPSGGTGNVVGAGGVHPGTGGAVPGTGGIATGGVPNGTGSSGGTDAGSPSGGSGGEGDASAGGSGGTTTDAGTTMPPSCVSGGDGLSNCGPNANESCCKSPLVTGGTFYRSYDGVTYDHTSQAYPATVSDFRLDKYEVTVGRFRKFKAAWDAGYRPPSGVGKHTHLNGGNGLADSSGATTYESGWDPVWDSSVAPTDANLLCDARYQTWTSSAGANENRPINCASWVEQYAFCIWDGGFLPSEAEWNYAASGGDQQRVYPWSSPATSTSIDDTRTVYCGGTCSPQNVGVKPAGNGRYGQADLAGNIWEWNLDFYADPYATPCSDGSYLRLDTSGRMIRGGSFNYDVLDVTASYRYALPPSFRGNDLGARCARAP